MILIFIIKLILISNLRTEITKPHKWQIEWDIAFLPYEYNHLQRHIIYLFRINDLRQIFVHVLLTLCHKNCWNYYTMNDFDFYFTFFITTFNYFIVNTWFI